jgi:hypothetical protein
LVFKCGNFAVFAEAANGLTSYLFVWRHRRSGGGKQRDQRGQIPRAKARIVIASCSLKGKPASCAFAREGATRVFQICARTAKSVDERAFGYGNVGGLVATASNVPTATATAIWSPGMYKGGPWMPLMIRCNKFRHLVIG